MKLRLNFQGRIKHALLCMMFGITVIAASRVEAFNYVYSTTMDLSTGSYFTSTNNGVISEEFIAAFPGSQSFYLNPGDSISGFILFTNSQSLVVTNTTGTNSDQLEIDFYQSKPFNVELSGFSIQLFGVSGQLGSPNPFASSYGSSFQYLHQVASLAQVTTSSASFRAVAYSFTNINASSYLILAPDHLSVFSGLGDISVGTSTASIPTPPISPTNFTVLHTFAKNPDGANPFASLILSGNTLYGTASAGGTNGDGMVFAVHTDGTDFTNLHSFTGGSDGAIPYASLILSSNTLYGTAAYGGVASGYSGNGTVFAVNTDGTGFTNLHSFTAGNYDSSSGSVSNSDGANPYGSLILSGNTLYGTTRDGGSSGNGAVFAINTDGTDFTNLHSFTAANYDGNTGSSTNSDGVSSTASLILSGNTLYGTASSGGNSGYGTVFAVNTDGTDFTNLHSFTLGLAAGGNPVAGLVLSGNTLYGTTEGTVFAVNTDGTSFTNLHNFTATSGPDYTNSDGFFPQAGLFLSGSTLYGTAFQGGGGGNGTLFQVNTNGNGFTNLYSFTPSAPNPNQVNGDGAYPHGGLILSANTLYGTAEYGGSSGAGTVFALALNNLILTPVPLNIQPAGNAVVLSWTNPAFVLQSAPAVTGTFTNIPGATSPFTNFITDPQKFFRLQSN
jgi:uncharacterized repeat protein (TIGR03803 family)